MSAEVEFHVHIPRISHSYKLISSQLTRLYDILIESDLKAVFERHDTLLYYLSFKTQMRT